ncbi:MAG: TonB C-terminal domain-containing protein, partial [Candidatus Latescibacteria bacterium]|nr:TonB C-terminal domain-containing protein [Candidatus Latescibacterota bacterium]
RLDSAFDYPDYLATLRNRIWENFDLPFEGSNTDARRATVYFRILRDGKVEGVYVESGSGSLPFDRSAYKAVIDLNGIKPLPPLPQAFVGEHLGVHFGFEYEPELM